MAALLEGGGDPSIGLVYKKRSLSLMQMIMLNAVVCGLEFCASAGFTYIPPLLLKTGLSESRMTFVMGLGPLLGIFLVPVLGKASDRCKSAYGRRRPFIFWLSIGCIISLLVIPYAQIITERVLGAESFGRTIGVLVLCAGVVLLDFTTQACLNPCEALLSDASKGTEQQDSIFTVYSVMISVGGCLGYFITAIDWKSSSFGLYFTSQEQSAFSLLIVLFTVSLLATLHVAEERPVRSGLLQPVAGEDPSKIQQESGYETSSNSSISEAGPSSVVISPTHHQHSLQRTNSLQERLRSSVKPVCSLINTDCHLPFRSRLLMAMAYRLRTFWHGIVNCLPTGVKQFCNMPVVLKRLVMADFCSWTAIMAFNFFYTDFMGQAVYGGSPNAEESSPLRDLYDQGVRMGSWGLLFHCIVSAVFAPFVERLSDKFGPRKTFISGMMSFSVAMMLMVFVTNARMVSLMAALTGFGYACVTIIPFTLVTEYHQDQEVYFYDTRIASSPGSVDGESPHIPVRGMAGDMAMLDSAYFFSEVALSLVMGYIVHYSGTAKAYMVTAAVLGVAACFLILRVLTDKQEVISRIREQRQLKNLQLTTES